MNITVAETLAQALKEAQPLAADYHKTLDRALDYVRGKFSYELRSGDTTLICQSQTSENTYETTLTTCDCPGFLFTGHCFHPALLSLCLAYQTLHAAATAVVAVRRPQPARQQQRGVRHVETPLYVAPAPRSSQRVDDDEWAAIMADVDEMFN